MAVAGRVVADVRRRDAHASGHGPVFGAATPTLGRGGWSVDQAWTMRLGEEVKPEQMLKTMVTFGITEVLQVSGSVPLAMSSNSLAPGRMMSAMSNDREFEGLRGIPLPAPSDRHRRPAREHVLRRRHGAAGVEEEWRRRRRIGRSSGSPPGYASRAHYAWIGGGVQHYFPRNGDRLGDSRMVTFVYGYRPPALRTEAGKPDLRFFVESTFEDRQADRRCQRPRAAGRADRVRRPHIVVGLQGHRARGRGPVPGVSAFAQRPGDRQGRDQFQLFLLAKIG